MTLTAAIHELRRLPVEKQVYVSEVIARLKVPKRTRKAGRRVSLWDVLDALKFNSGNGGLSEHIDEFTGRRY